MKKKHIVLLSILLISSNLVGCASITTGTTQSVSVKTGTIKNATCSLENNKGKWYVNRTPGSVTIRRSFNDLTVDCEKRGFTGHKRVASNTKAMAFGNILFGGVIGAGVDVANGAAYDYPVNIEVPMKKVTA